MKDCRCYSLSAASPSKKAARGRFDGRLGHTLVELTLVVFLLGLVSSLASLRLCEVREQAKIRAAQADLASLREGFIGTAGTPGYLSDMGGLPGFSPAFLRVHNLLTRTNLLGRAGLLLDDNAPRPGYADFACFTNWNAETGRGWHGPYIRVAALVKNSAPAREGLYPYPSDRRSADDSTFAARGFFPRRPDAAAQPFAYGQGGEPAVGDPWGNPYVLQIPAAEAFDAPSEAARFRYARLVSAGPDGVLQTPCFSGASPTAAQRRLLRLAGRLPDGSTAPRGDDLVLFINRPDLFEDHE